jgi:hypothetical protein
MHQNTKCNKTNERTNEQTHEQARVRRWRRWCWATSPMSSRGSGGKSSRYVYHLLLLSFKFAALAVWCVFLPSSSPQATYLRFSPRPESHCCCIHTYKSGAAGFPEAGGAGRHGSRHPNCQVGVDRYNSIIYDLLPVCMWGDGRTHARKHERTDNHHPNFDPPHTRAIKYVN